MNTPIITFSTNFKLNKTYLHMSFISEIINCKCTYHLSIIISINLIIRKFLLELTTDLFVRFFLNARNKKYLSISAVGHNRPNLTTTKSFQCQKVKSLELHKVQLYALQRILFYYILYALDNICNINTQILIICLNVYKTFYCILAWDIDASCTCTFKEWITR